jgi:hypothetical protein
MLKNNYRIIYFITAELITLYCLKGIEISPSKPYTRLILLEYLQLKTRNLNPTSISTHYFNFISFN